VIENELQSIVTHLSMLNTSINILTFELQQLNDNLTEAKRVAQLLKRDNDEPRDI